MSSEFFHSKPRELVRRVRENPATLLRIPEKAGDLLKWRKINHTIDIYVSGNGGMQFVQIGTNDGVRGDPIHRRVMRGGWTGLMIEPIEEHIVEAQRNYMEVPGLRFLQAAVTSKDGPVTMKRFKHEAHAGTGVESHSLHPDAIAKSAQLLGIRSPEKWVEDIEVAGISFSTLADLPEFGSPDFLAIDAEGSDEEILRALLETPVRPPLILYENLFMSPQVQTDLAERFRTEGYKSITTSQDTFISRTSSL